LDIKEIEERENAITSFVIDAQEQIIDLAKDKAVKRGFDPRKISKIEAGNRVKGLTVFWVKICERQREGSGEKIEFVDDVYDKDNKHFYRYYIRATF